MTPKNNSVYATKSVILFLVDEYIYGGVTSFVRQYTEAAHVLGHSCIILGFKGDIEQPSTFFPYAKTVVIDGSIRHNSLLGKIANGFLYVRALKHLYETEHITLLHMSTTWSSIYAALTLESWRVKKCTTVYGLYHKEYLSEQGTHYQPQQIVKAAMLKGLQHLSLRWSERLVTFSSYAKRLIHESYPSLPTHRLVIIPGATTVKPLLKHVPRKKVLNAVWIGRAEPRKGVKELLRAISLVNLSRTRYKAYIASPMRFYAQYGIFDEYEQLNLSFSVHMLHKANDATKRELFELADVFVMPSQDLETFGLTILESLSYGIPVIGTPVGAIPEILRHIDRRLIAEGTSSKDIANRLMWFSRLRLSERMRLAEKARQYVRNYHSMNMQIKLYEFLYG